MRETQRTGQGEVTNALFTAHCEFIDVQTQCMLFHDGRKVKIKGMGKLSKTDQSSQYM
jgi:hypothetical protein